MTSGPRKIEACLSPNLAGTYEIGNKTVVVIDILRATSCWITALAHGAKAVRPVGTLEECAMWRQKGYLGAAERQGRKSEGFEFGNSPFEFSTDKVTGKRIVSTTTNGSLTAERFKSAFAVLAGGFINFSSLIYKLKTAETDIILACAGWEGNISLEDTLFAGMVIDALHPAKIPADDSALMALTIWKIAGEDYPGWLKVSTHVQRLLRLGLHDDVAYCMQKDLFTVVPFLEKEEFKV